MKLTLYDGSQIRTVTFTRGATLLSILRNAGFRNIPSTCGGKGSCRKCAVYVRRNGQEGWCLACFTPAEDGMIVDLTKQR